MNESYAAILKLAESKKVENKKFFKRLKQKKAKDLDMHFHSLHEEVFDKVNCLECANCCSTTSPIFYDRDIERLAKHLRIKASIFIEKYLRMDDEGDYVLKTAPCSFLSDDNYCSVYEARPKACREYPHTDRKNMIQILGITQKNIAVCPAVAEIVEKMKQLV